MSHVGCVSGFLGFGAVVVWAKTGSWRRRGLDSENLGVDWGKYYLG